MGGVGDGEWREVDGHNFPLSCSGRGFVGISSNSGGPLGCASGDWGWAEWGMGSGGKWMPTTFHTVAANGQEKVSFQF